MEESNGTHPLIPHGSTDTWQHIQLPARQLMCAQTTSILATGMQWSGRTPIALTSQSSSMPALSNEAD
jgi:hypothetical protein